MGRSPFSTHPSMGLPPTWKVSDLTPSYSSPVAVITANALATFTSNAYNPEGNSVELYAQFSDGATKCDIAVQSDDGTGTFNTVATFTGVNLFKASGLTVGEWPTGISLKGRAIKIVISNQTGGGTVSVLVQRLN